MAGLENHTNSLQQTARHSSLRQQEQRQPDTQVSSWDEQVAMMPQRTLGNQALARRSNAAGTFTTQAKLTVGPAADQYENEADTVASQVVQGIQAQRMAPAEDLQRDSNEEELQMKRVNISTLQREEEEELQAKRVDSSVLQREEGEEEEDEELQAKRVDSSVLQREEGAEEEDEELQAKRDPASGAQGGVVGDEIESTIRSQRGGGSPIAEETRGAMESGFNADFSGVRVHQGASADALNRSLSARAFTSGSDIFFRSGEYDPGSQQGQQLLAHELTHVVQQGAAQQGQK